MQAGVRTRNLDMERTPQPQDAARVRSASATRASLLLRIRDWQDDDSWQDFFQTYWRVIYSLAVSSGLTETEAEDVVQATVVSVASKIRDFKYDPKVGSFKSWLMTQARWRISDQFRERERQRERFPRRPRAGEPISPTATATVERVPDQNAGMEKVWERDWQMSVFNAALRSLSNKINPKHYQVFHLYAVRKWPAKKISKTFGIGRPQIYVIHARVKRLLKQETARIEEQFQREPLLKLSKI